MRNAVLCLSLLVLGALSLRWITTDDSRAWGQKHIVFILIDTLRADHLGCYGYERETSPRIDALANEGFRFDAAHSVAPWTNPTIATLFTGRYPQAVFPAARHPDAIRQALPQELDTLAEVLGGAGYRTIGLIDHPGINAGLNWSQGFDEFVPLYRHGDKKFWDATDSDYVLGEVAKQLDTTGDQPLFMYLHLVYPHLPYDLQPPYLDMFGPGFEELAREERPNIINGYDAEIRFTDDVVGDVVSMLRERGMLDESWLVLTSDHGEAFWDHDVFEHGDAFHEELLRIPLIIRPPAELALLPRVIEEFVSHVDLYPTLLEMANVAPPGVLDGTSYLPLILGEERDPGTELRFGESPHRGNIHRSVVFDGRYKLVRDDDQTELFDLEQDPAEQEPLPGRTSMREGFLRALDEHRTSNELRRRQISVTERELDQETVERLRALGYTDS